jgi:hypothetical protein
VRADHLSEEATTTDIRALQREVDRLDASLMGLDDENSRAAQPRGVAVPVSPGATRSETPRCRV